jgi:RNA polymerase sigma-70 factor (ECF subfamily)
MIRQETFRATEARTFERHRPLLFSIAYRMLGSAMDAEDVVQEAYLRWRETDEEIRSPKAYLSTVVTCLSIDRLRSAKVQREKYVGPWLPDPIATGEDSRIAGAPVLEETLSMAFLVLLESLTPVERAVFLLREVFDYDYAEISRIVGKTEANCRQIASRTRQALAARRPRFESSQKQQERMIRLFVETCATGDMRGLLSLLSEDVIFYSDGGGKAVTARDPVSPVDRVARLLLGLASKRPVWFADIRFVEINGQPGIVGYSEEHPTNVLTLEIAGEHIRAVRTVQNPDKLRAVPQLGDIDRKEDR